MNRWIDGNWLLNFFEPYPDDYQTPLGALRACVEDAPTLDFVTCGECRHCLTDIVVQRREDGYERAINLCQCPRHKEEWSVDKNWYCADGERKESE